MATVPASWVVMGCISFKNPTRELGLREVFSKAAVLLGWVQGPGNHRRVRGGSPARRGHRQGPLRTGGNSYAEVIAIDPAPGTRDAARTDIREFLSTRRARVTPEAAGLPAYGGDRRRVTGLRREEVALLAGISPQYYIRLERGDATGASDSIVQGIAGALQLDDAEYAHLLDLIRTAGSPRQPQPRRPPAAQRVRPTIQRLVDAMHLTPAVIQNGRLDVLAANALGRALFAPALDHPHETPNMARFVFVDPRAPDFFREWDRVAGDTVAILRAEAGRTPHDRPMSDLIGQLATRSDEFRIRWAAHDVRVHATGVKLIHHPVVGDLDLPFESLPLAAGSSSNLVAYTPEPDSPAHVALTLLASWTAADQPAPASLPPTS